MEIVAPGPQGAALTAGPPGHAHRPAVEDHPVAEIVGLLGGQDLPQLLLHLGRVLGAVGEAQQAGDADAEMCIRDRG